MKTGEDLLNLADTHVGEKYALGILVPKNIENWKGPYDCAEFVSYIIFQVSGILYGVANDKGNPASADAYTGYFQRDAASIGETISVADAIATPGACLLRFAGEGELGHIVFSDGKGGTMEANCTKYGLIKSTALGRRWSIGIKIPGIEYITNESAPQHEQPDVIFLTSPFMQGNEVVKVQQALLNKGYSLNVDGKFGPGTAAVVKAFQIANGELVPDGEVGQKTASALGITL